MNNPRPTAGGLSIDHLSMRVPGNDDAAGRRIAQQTGELLASGAAGLSSRHIGALRLRIHAPADASEADLASAVSAAILDHLHRPDHA